MEKIWYVYIEGKKEGPYDVGDLRSHPKVTPDTLAWRPGFSQWVPMRSIFELIEVFKDEELKDEEEVDNKPPFKSLKPIEDDTLALRYEPPTFYLWIFVAIVIVLYTFYLLYNGQR